MSRFANVTLTRSIPWVDHFAIGASLLCLAHCLLMPVLLVVIPSMTASIITGESVHVWLICIVIPSSLFALGVGCRQHGRRSFLIIGLSGLSFLILGACAELMNLKHTWEQTFTVVGSLLIAFAHLRNFRMCQKTRSCSCH